MVLEKRPLKVFLCHASGDKPPVRDLYKRLTAEGVDAWLDKEKLLPGQDWRLEIPKAVREADVVVVCLSDKSITKEGYVQKEIKFALDIAEEKPEGTIFLIPARLEDCVVPERLSRWHWVDLYEENGFIQLLRSLKLRAEAVGAAVEPAPYADSAQETDHKLEQWYTEGLAAFYTEDWDRACQRFQSILSERPNHKHAAEKLEEAERQRDLSRLYEQASAAVRGEDWGNAIRILEELSHKSAEYKDSAQLLRDARKQKQLRELYAEAKALHAAGKWEAVVRVFQQISAIDQTFPDTDGLLPSAQKKVVELKRLAELNDQYSRALREMDLGNWYEARRLLETVHKSQTGFLETEKLLKKVEGEIAREEQKRRQNDQVNTLYEQAHGLLRSKKWRNALDKMEEIRKLDDHFPDVDGIAEKAQKELAREEQEAERQNRLAALYAEAVRLLKEEKYQEALDKWGEVRSVDPKYPDRQWVARTAKRKLGGIVSPVAQIESPIPSFRFLRSLSPEWLLLLAFLAIIIVRAIYGVINSQLYIEWGPEAPFFPQFFNLFVIGGLYGTVVALSLGKVFQNWSIWQILTVIAGWALGWGSLIIMWDRWEFFLSINIVIASLSIAGAVKWANPRLSWFTVALVFVSWAIVWKIGTMHAAFIKDTFNNDYVWCIIEATTTLAGLLATLGVCKYPTKRLVVLTTLSMLGFAAGGLVAFGLFRILMHSSQIAMPVSLAAWGFIGGIIVKLPARDWKKTLAWGGVCGLAFLLGQIIVFLVLPTHMLGMWPERYAILRNIILGSVLGLAFGLLSRRISSISVLVILGSWVVVFTGINFLGNNVVSYENIWRTIMGGGLIGLVLGFGYAYLTREDKSQQP